MRYKGIFGGNIASYTLGLGLALLGSGCNYAEKQQITELERTISGQAETINRLEGRINTEHESRQQLGQTIGRLSAISNLGKLQELLESVGTFQTQADTYINRMQELETSGVATTEDMKTLLQDYREAYGDKDKRTGIFGIIDKAQVLERDLAAEIERAKAGDEAITQTRLRDLRRQARSLEVFRSFYFGPLGEDDQRTGGSRSLLLDLSTQLDSIYSKENPDQMRQYLNRITAIPAELDRLYQRRTRTRDREGLPE